jgi:8-oxo-dGTP pyrophosphatase MutT (NUDIX family)
MKKDLSLMVDGYNLNIRVGIIFKYHGKVLIEIRKDRVGNSVIPGGRMKVDENRVDTLKREIMEEMHYRLDEDKIEYIDTIESFFKFNGVKVHEFFFVYQYDMNDKIYDSLSQIKENLDGANTDYIFVSPSEFNDVNLLPMELRDIINNR